MYLTTLRCHVLYYFQDFLFRNIQRSEWEPLFSFINQRKIRIENLAEARQGPRAAAPAIDFGLGEDLDVGVRAARAEAGKARCASFVCISRMLAVLHDCSSVTSAAWTCQRPRVYSETMSLCCSIISTAQ